MRSQHWTVLNHWRLIEEWPLLGVCGGQQRSVWICLLTQFVPHFIYPFNEYLLNTHSGLATIQNAEKTMFLRLVSRQEFIVSSCLQFNHFWGFLSSSSNWCMLCYIRHALCSRWCQAFWTNTSSSSQHLYSCKYYYLILRMRKLAQRGKWFVNGHPFIDGIAEIGTQIGIIRKSYITLWTCQRCLNHFCIPTCLLLYLTHRGHLINNCQM